MFDPTNAEPRSGFGVRASAPLALRLREVGGAAVRRQRAAAAGRGGTRIASGLGVVALALAGSRASEQVDLWRFAIAWWGVVLALDGAVRLRHGAAPFARP